MYFSTSMRPSPKLLMASAVDLSKPLRASSASACHARQVVQEGVSVGKTTQASTDRADKALAGLNIYRALNGSAALFSAQRRTLQSTGVAGVMPAIYSKNRRTHPGR